MCVVGSGVGDRRAEVLSALRGSRSPLDDDQLAQAIPMNRHYVNAICRALATEQIITRYRGPDGKLVNAFASSDQPNRVGTRPPVSSSSGTSGSRQERSRATDANVESLIANFPECVAEFEHRGAFPGPSLYFHERAIELRRRHPSVVSLLADERFLEYVYAVLPAWGMHRMGAQRAKVADFAPIVAALRECAPALQALWPLHIAELTADEASEAAETAWGVVSRINVSSSRTQIVAGSKFLHHVLPDLVPPIDRQYTFSFFTGQKAVPSDRLAFLSWMPRFAEIGTRCREPIEHAIRRRGFMATGEAKVIDNAIMGFMQRQRSGSPGAEPAAAEPVTGAGG